MIKLSKKSDLQTFVYETVTKNIHDESMKKEEQNV